MSTWNLQVILLSHSGYVEMHSHIIGSANHATFFLLFCFCIADTIKYRPRESLGICSENVITIILKKK